MKCHRCRSENINIYESEDEKRVKTKNREIKDLRVYKDNMRSIVFDDKTWKGKHKRKSVEE